MGVSTGIAWTDHTFNIAFGCQKVSPGCKNCYAETRVNSIPGPRLWGPDSQRRTFTPKYWAEPFKWAKLAQAEGRPHRVFTSSMCDVFEDHVTITHERMKLWKLIKQTPWLHWQILTKRTDRIEANLPDDWGQGYPNVWLGTSIENQDYAYRADILRKIPAAIHFISYEPALGPLTLDLHDIEWVIVGGESGPGFREMPHEWARSMRKQCEAAGTAFFFKQSSAPRTEMGIKLDGEIVRNYPKTSSPESF